MHKNIFWKIVKDIAMLWWSFWSNIRFKDSIRNNINIKDEDKVKNLSDIKKLVQKLYKKFKWTKDGIDQLGDAITPPPQNYQHYLDGILKDDCDGFHSLVYHCLFNSDIKCYLLTANPVKGGHCVLLFNLNKKWHVNDYTRVYGGYDTPEEAISTYNIEYQNRYKKKEVVLNGIIEYNYTTGKFYPTSLEKIKKEN